MNVRVTMNQREVRRLQLHLVPIVEAMLSAAAVSTNTAVED